EKRRYVLCGKFELKGIGKEEEEEEEEEETLLLLLQHRRRKSDDDSGRGFAMLLDQIEFFFILMSNATARTGLVLY
ncbi:hypothetical protein A2U01_0038012, partial [Trifolium medium]|nr:hypothetical protein [Trifolium medium]